MAQARARGQISGTGSLTVVVYDEGEGPVASLGSGGQTATVPIPLG